MSDGGDKTCPLCAEDMDMTDQQLKPCRCGYEVCVWCWHHIMEMAEKDDTEGRCPACRTPYDKERIVATAASCERLVAEVNMEKKHKTQKARSKTPENRKQLTSVRVIQRHLVYIVGLPLNLADEDLLQRKDYFGRYGKVLKVSISRTSAGTIQQFPNSTCSVYITYAMEDEAARCIQSVNGFILDGRPLRVCFGTTKYCHAWLRNVPCNNPDCLYLHEIGSLEDSFTKDEIISAYSRVQEITGITMNTQRRSGNVLPPPADNYCNDNSVLTGKPVPKSSANNLVSSTRVSPPSSSSGRSGSLPSAASWGARASNGHPPAESVATSNGPVKQKVETVHAQPVVAGTPQTSNFPNDIGKSHDTDEGTHARQTNTKIVALDTDKHHTVINSNTNVSEASSRKSDCHEGEGSTLHKTRYSTDKQHGSPFEHEDSGDLNNQKPPNGVSSSSVDKLPNGDHTEALKPSGLSLDNFISHNDYGIQWHKSEKLSEHSGAAGKAATAINSLTVTGELQNLKSDVTSETVDDFDNQRLRDAIVNQAPIPASSPLHIFSHLQGSPSQPEDVDFTGNYNVNPPIVNRVYNEGLGLKLPSASVSSNGFLEHLVNHASTSGNTLINDVQGNHLGQFSGEMMHPEPGLDMGESNIISNILSLDLDSWDDSLTSPRNLAKLLADKKEFPIKSTNSWKNQISNQSRFSFARQEDSTNHLFNIEATVGSIGYSSTNPSFDQAFAENRGRYVDRLANGFGFPHRNMEVSDNLLVSRSQISAPPGFAAPNRPPPPGFSSQERIDQSFDFFNSGNQLHETSSFLGNQFHASNGNISTTNDIEFMDPAILAVGKGRFPTGANSSCIDMRPNFHGHAPGFDSDSRLQFLMQRSISPHQDHRYTENRDSFSPSSEAFDFNYRHMEHANNVSHFSHFSPQQPRNTVFSNGHLDGWSEIQSPNDMGIAELLRNDRLGYNKLYGGYEDPKFRMTNSGDVYNRSFGM